MLEIYGTAFGAMRQSYGGDTFNTAVYLSRCGGSVIKTWYASALGDDALSLELQQRWAQDGLALDLVRTIAGRMPGLYQIQVDNKGERRFSFWRENSAAKSYFDTEMTPLEARMDEWDAFYFSGISLAILPPVGRERLFAFARALRTRGTEVVFDNNYRNRLWPDIDVARDSFLKAFAVATIALITADDHQALFGLESLPAAVRAAQELPIRELVIKRGSEPTLVRSSNEPWQSVPVKLVQQVVDTTAAGDSFAAGYLSRRLLGENPIVSASFGNELAARVIQYHGAIIPPETMTDLV